MVIRNRAYEGNFCVLALCVGTGLALAAVVISAVVWLVSTYKGSGL